MTQIHLCIGTVKGQQTQAGLSRAMQDGIGWISHGKGFQGKLTAFGSKKAGIKGNGTQKQRTTPSGENFAGNAPFARKRKENHPPATFPGGDCIISVVSWISG
ncbi:hypothetical protein ACQKLP_00855 [Chitinophaga sp. NPDC101104]|uniref:hypothetical protein n=1 Tax=Chitinophaga sp. NPDC101104 TaxID=3390561 RepID=UPI003CFDCF4B